MNQLWNMTDQLFQSIKVCKLLTVQTDEPNIKHMARFFLIASETHIVTNYIRHGNMWMDSESYGWYTYI